MKKSFLLLSLIVASIQVLAWPPKNYNLLVATAPNVTFENIILPENAKVVKTMQKK